MGVYANLITLGFVLFLSLIGGIYFILRKAFNIKVQVYEQTGGGIVVSERRAKKVETPEGNKLVFFSLIGKSKDTMALPTGDYFFLTKKRTFLLNLYKNKANNYSPIPLRWNEKLDPLFVPDDNDMRFWKTVMDKETETVYAKDENWFARNKEFIILSMLCCTALIILLFYGQMYFKGIKEVAQPLTGSINSLQGTLGGLIGRGGV